MEAVSVQNISPSHSHDSGIDDSIIKVGDRGRTSDDLFSLFDCNTSNFADLDEILSMDTFLHDSFWEHGGQDACNKESPLLPFLESMDPDSNSVKEEYRYLPVSRTSSVELDHSYVVSKLQAEASTSPATENIEQRIEVVSCGNNTLSHQYRKNDDDRLVTDKAGKVPRPSFEDAKAESRRCGSEGFTEVDKSRKNAENARLNRQRKKRYVENLEREIKSLRTTNSALMTERKNLKDLIENLQDQLTCLKNVLANDSTLSVVMKAVTSAPGVQFSDNCLQPSVVAPSRRSSKRTRQNSLPVGNKKPKKSTVSSLTLANDQSREGAASRAGGICLHVRNDVISLALCTACSKSVDTE